MRKVPAVAQVRVSLKDGLTVLDLKPGNSVKLSELRQIIRNNGFVSKEATAVAAGAPSPDQKSFSLSGTTEQVMLASPPQPNRDLWRIAIRAPDAQR